MNPRVLLRWVKKCSNLLILIGSLTILLFTMKTDVMRMLFLSA